MDESSIEELYNEVNVLAASLELYDEFCKKKATSENEKEHFEMKVDLIKEEALRHNLKVRRLIDRLGY